MSHKVYLLKKIISWSLAEQNFDLMEKAWQTVQWTQSEGRNVKERDGKDEPRTI